MEVNYFEWPWVTLQTPSCKNSEDGCSRWTKHKLLQKECKKEGAVNLSHLLGTAYFRQWKAGSRNNCGPEKNFYLLEKSPTTTYMLVGTIWERQTAQGKERNDGFAAVRKTGDLTSTGRSQQSVCAKMSQGSTGVLWKKLEEAVFPPWSLFLCEVLGRIIS